MIAAQWRERLTYLAMSLVVGWHSFAIIVAPMPDGSAMVQWFRFLIQPYVSLFRLDNHWNFFAPSVGKHRQFRYIVEDAAGERHTFVPAQDMDWSLPRYVMWREFKYLHDGVMENPEAYGERVTRLLCQKHASLKPASVSMLQVLELDFWPDDYLQGYRPLDPAFVTMTALTNASC